MMDVANYNPSTKFDIIIADPPYDRFEPDEIMHLSRNLTSDGIFVNLTPTNKHELNQQSIGILIVPSGILTESQKLCVKSGKCGKHSNNNLFSHNVNTFC
jgi:16S rRNA G966 N2-methylase RsmD